MECKINRTHEGVKKFPVHAHGEWEVMCYTAGTGIMNTDAGKIPFSPGTVIAVPPRMKHGSQSHDCFQNIAIEADFSLLFEGDQPISVTDTACGEAIILAGMIWENRYGDKALLHALIQSLACWINSKISSNDLLQKTVLELRDEICRRFSDAEFRPETLLRSSHYTPDYIRNRFRQIIGYTPVEFLNRIRISEAERIFEIYGRSISVARAAELCGFSDPVYFSRYFKKITGVSPQKFKTPCK